MIEIKCNCILSGEKFSPDNIMISEKLIIVQKYNVGDLILEGRYKGSNSVEGSLILNGSVNNIIEFIERIYQNSIIKETITGMNITLNVLFDVECNFELTEMQLNKLALFKIPIGISCYKE